MLNPLLTKLNQVEALAPDDHRAFLNLPYRLGCLKAGQSMVREGEHSSSCSGLLSGFAYRHRTLRNGARQIISMHVPGDFPDLQSGLLGLASHTVQMLTPGRVAIFRAKDIQRLVNQRPAIQAALWRETLIDMSICGEWVANVGRRDAQSRLAHLICEFATRLQAAGLLPAEVWQLPMTQEQLADAAGLTSVHVNRTLQTMRHAGLIRIERRGIEILDWARLVTIADFNPSYLHLRSAEEISVAG
jgi:CRP-like cAMP-binding protein